MDAAGPNGVLGTVVWRIERAAAVAGKKPGLAIRGDVEIPERKMSVHLSLSRNADRQFPARPAAR
jgi:hypothetical protein